MKRGHDVTRIDWRLFKQLPERHQDSGHPSPNFNDGMSPEDIAFTLLFGVMNDNRVIAVDLLESSPRRHAFQLVQTTTRIKAG